MLLGKNRYARFDVGSLASDHSRQSALHSFYTELVEKSTLEKNRRNVMFKPKGKNSSTSCFTEVLHITAWICFESLLYYMEMPRVAHSLKTEISLFPSANLRALRYDSSYRWREAFHSRDEFKGRRGARGRPPPRGRNFLMSDCWVAKTQRSLKKNTGSALTGGGARFATFPQERYM